MSTTSGSPGISTLLEPNLPKPHIQQLHLRIGQVLALHSAPRFLEAVVVGLVEVHEFEDCFRLYSWVVTLYVLMPSTKNLSYAGTQPCVPMRIFVLRTGDTWVATSRPATWSRIGRK